MNDNTCAKNGAAAAADDDDNNIISLHNNIYTYKPTHTHTILCKCMLYIYTRISKCKTQFAKIYHPKVIICQALLPSTLHLIDPRMDHLTW